MKTKSDLPGKKWHRPFGGIEIEPEQVFAIIWMTLKEERAPNGKLLSSSMNYQQSNVQARNAEEAIRKLRKHWGGGDSGNGCGGLVINSVTPSEIKIHIT